MTPRVRWFAALCLLLVQTAHVAPLLAAAEPTPNEIAVARRLFAEATALRERGRWREAAEKLRRAIGIKDTPGLRYHHGYCQAQLGRLVEALVEYDRADELIRSGVAAPDVQRLLDVAREDLRERVPLLTIEVPETMQGAVLEVDSDRISPLLVGQPIPLNLGWHTLVVAAPGYLSYERRVQLREGQKVVLRVDAEPAPSAPIPAKTKAPQPTKQAAQPPPHLEDDSGFSTRTYLLLAEGGLTLASAGFAVVFNFVEASSSDRMARAQVAADSEYRIVNPGTDPTEPVSGFSCHGVDPSRTPWQEACAALDDAIEERDRAHTFQIVGYVGAGVGASAMLATYLFWPTEEKRPVSFLAAPVRSGFLASVRVQF